MSELSELHQSLARVVIGGRDLSEVLTEITGIAKRAMPGADSTSITLIRNERPFTAAYEGKLALDADELQYERGYGPCVDAGRAGQIFLVEDMRTERRWPDYARHAAARGVGSSLSVPLPFQGALIGALNNYSVRPHSFSQRDVVLGEEIAGWVAITVNNAEKVARSEKEIGHLREAMHSRASIEQAKGMLMERYAIDQDQAFKVLTRVSQQTNVRLRELADTLVRTRELPGLLGADGASAL